MARKTVQAMARAAWTLARRQHFVITRKQLPAIGYTSEAIDHRIETRWLHPIHAGVYAVARGDLTREGYFMAAVLACGPGAALSHESAAELYAIRPRTPGPIHVSVPASRRATHEGIKVHRRTGVEVRELNGIPVTRPIDTIVDIAPGLTDPRLERAINEAANRDLVDPEYLRENLPSRPGARKVARLLDRDTFVVTETRLEQRFVPIALAAGLGRPETQIRTEGGRADFLFRDLEMLVEANSLRFHRTAAQQRADTVRHQKDAAAGYFPLRFTHWQIFNDPDYVRDVLAKVAARQRAVLAARGRAA